MKTLYGELLARGISRHTLRHKLPDELTQQLIGIARLGGG